MTALLQTHAILQNGTKMPMVGLGTWQSKGGDVERAVDVALSAGYRHIDTAFTYGNEHEVGRAIRKWLDSGKLQRDELFICTKLPMKGNHESCVEKYLKKSLEALQLDYVDLYLVHIPVGIPDTDGEPLRNADGTIVIDRSTDLLGIWRGMEAQVDAGRTRNIGISNFRPDQVERMIQGARIKPVNLQIELHAEFQQNILREICEKHAITVTAYAPLGSTGRQNEKFPDLLGNATVKKIAEKHKKTPAQVLLRHLVQKAIVVIPKSVTPYRIVENFQIFDFCLSEEEVKLMDELDLGPAGRSFHMQSLVDGQKHPEWPF